MVLLVGRPYLEFDNKILTVVTVLVPSCQLLPCWFQVDNRDAKRSAGPR